MGLRWSTPRVFGVSYGTRIGPGRSVGCLPMLGLFVVLGGVIEAAQSAVTWLAVPLLIVLFWSIRWMKRQQHAVVMNPPSRSQASVSNRR